MTYILFFVYLILFSWLTTRMPGFKKSGLPGKWLIILFLAKVAGGLFYGFIYSGHADTSDSWQIFNVSLIEYRTLIDSPSTFFKNLGRALTARQDESYANVFGTTGSFWNYLKDRLIVNIEAFINVFTTGKYYVNVIFYAFLTFGGYIAFYRGLQIIYPGSRVTSMLAVFFIPSSFFWTSGMYKDGILFMLLGYIVYQVAVLSTGARKLMPIVYIGLCMLCIFVLRNYIVLLLLPCLLAWWLSFKTPSKTRWYFGGILAICAVTFFAVPFLFPSMNLPAFLIARRNEFMLLTANTALPASAMKPNVISYLTTLPEAFNFGFLRPYIWENKGWFYLPFAVELVAFYGLLIVHIRKQAITISSAQYSFWYFSILFLCCNWILLGYIATVTGALIRYKSLFIPFPAAYLFYYYFPRLNTLDL